MNKLIFVISLIIISTNCFSQVVGSGQATWNGEYSCGFGSIRNPDVLEAEIVWKGPILTSYTVGFTFTKSGQSLKLDTKLISSSFENKIMTSFGDIGTYNLGSFTNQLPQLAVPNLGVNCQIFYNGALVELPDFRQISIGVSNQRRMCCGSKFAGCENLTSPLAQQICDNNFEGNWTIKINGTIFSKNVGTTGQVISNIQQISSDFEKFMMAKKNKEKDEKIKAIEAKKQEQAKITEQTQSNKNQTTEQKNNSSTSSAPKSQSQTNSNQSTEQANQQDITQSYQKQQEQENERRRQEQNRELARQKQQSKENYERQLEQSKQIEDARTNAYSAIENAIYGTPEQRQARMARRAEENRLQEEQDERNRIERENSRRAEEEKWRIAAENNRIEAENLQKRNNYFENAIPAFSMPNTYKDANLTEVYFFYAIRINDKNISFSSVFPLRKSSDNFWPYKSDIDNKLKMEVKAFGYKLVGFFTDLNSALERQQQLIAKAQQEGFNVDGFKYNYKDYTNSNVIKNNSQPKSKTSGDFWNK